MLLDKKSYALLFHLLALEEPETVMMISKQLDQSRRKIYYHLDKINEAIPSDVGQIISYPRVGIVLNTEQKKACLDLVAHVDDYFYIMNVKERIQMMLIYIAVSKERVTIDKLVQLTGVSRNTVLSDLSAIRQELSQGQGSIALNVSKSQGYYLDCHPKLKIRYLYQLLHTVYTKGTENFIIIVRDKITDFLDCDIFFSDAVKSYFKGQMLTIGSELGKKINRHESDFMISLLPYLFLSYRNIQLTEDEKTILHSEFVMVRRKKEFHIAQYLADGLEKNLKITLDDIEVSLLATLLLSYRKDSDNHLESQDYADMKRVLIAFIDQIEQHYNLVFQQKDELVKRILTHCKALIYRKEFGILSSKPLTEHIKEKYREIFEITKATIPILEKAWSIDLIEDDIAYLAIHIGGSLQRKDPKTKRPLTLSLVCDEGVGIQRLFLSQCSHYLPDCKIEAVLTSEQFQSIKDSSSTDLVVTTVDGLDSSFPVLQVQPILTDGDIFRLTRFVRNKGAIQEEMFTEKLRTCIAQYVSDETDRYVLHKKIEKIFRQELMMDIIGPDRYQDGT